MLLALPVAAAASNILFRCSAHPAEPSEHRFSELGFIAPGIMDVDGGLIGGRLVGWLLVVARWLVIIGYLFGWLVGDCWLSLLCPLLDFRSQIGQITLPSQILNIEILIFELSPRRETHF